MDTSPIDLAAFEAAWRSTWPDVPPIGWVLRGAAAKTWVRFHSLPHSKRYAENEAEYDELLRRHVTLMRELCSLTGSSTGDLRVITVAWSETAGRAERQSDLASAFPAAQHWQTCLSDDSLPDFQSWVSLYVGRTSVDAPELRALLRLVADDETGGVIVCPATVDWLYHPYDGGGDVIAPTRSIRDMLTSRHADWLSAHPEGL